MGAARDVEARGDVQAELAADEGAVDATLGRVAGQPDEREGAGYSDGNGVWGYEISLLYNVLQEENTLSLPLDFRFGITYNF